MSDETPAAKKKCVSCQQEMSEGASQCACGAYQSLKQCVSCYYAIPEQANRCTKCDSYQSWRRYLHIPETTLSLLTALVAVSSLVLTQVSNYSNRHSHTSVSFASADTDYVYVDVMNAGRSKSILRRAWLRFAPAPVRDPELVLAVDKDYAPRKVVPADGEVHLKYQVLGLALAEKGDVETLIESIKGQTLTLEIEVEESNGRVEKRIDQFAGLELGSLIANKLAEGN